MGPVPPEYSIGRLTACDKDRIARVRYWGLSVDATDVRVFFRTFQAQSTDTTYDRGCQAAQAARRRTSQTVAAMSSTDSASSQPPSIHWNDQNRLAG
jgi:hypothetical protein